ncbi:hypothetical protein PAXINDRAFT_156395 [Paxillus involutus ATCC 200175]|uniref:Uncharacterized protein n=1 Tax=Paxillus involutus ATCC 200175 TaxID=664439 RepID=A0A0C9U3H0_PAXIN|nr:hypothetical protein PAXINDRAFT_156395 [Paxillus involutus ATCC 200175]
MASIACIVGYRGGGSTGRDVVLLHFCDIDNTVIIDLSPPVGPCLSSFTGFHYTLIRYQIGMEETYAPCGVNFTTRCEVRVTAWYYDQGSGYSALARQLWLSYLVQGVGTIPVHGRCLFAADVRVRESESPRSSTTSTGTSPGRPSGSIGIGTASVTYYWNPGRSPILILLVYAEPSLNLPPNLGTHYRLVSARRSMFVGPWIIGIEFGIWVKQPIRYQIGMEETYAPCGVNFTTRCEVRVTAWYYDQGSGYSALARQLWLSYLVQGVGTIPVHGRCLFAADVRVRESESPRSSTTSTGTSPGRPSGSIGIGTASVTYYWNPGRSPILILLVYAEPSLNLPPNLAQGPGECSGELWENENENLGSPRTKQLVNPDPASGIGGSDTHTCELELRVRRSRAPRKRITHEAVAGGGAIADLAAVYLTCGATRAPGDLALHLTRSLGPSMFEIGSVKDGYRPKY